MEEWFPGWAQYEAPVENALIEVRMQTGTPWPVCNHKPVFSIT